jgi:nicotinamidase-related amidase
VGDRDVILNKPRYGGFHGTDLEMVLRSAGVDTVIISGIATNICCETTAREAAQRDFHVYFLSDGTATKEMNAGTGITGSSARSRREIMCPQRRRRPPQLLFL